MGLVTWDCFSGFLFAFLGWYSQYSGTGDTGVTAGVLRAAPKFPGLLQLFSGPLSHFFSHYSMGLHLHTNIDKVEPQHLVECFAAAVMAYPSVPVPRPSSKHPGTILSRARKQAVSVFLSILPGGLSNAA
jgi:hypothetical protein